MQSVADKDEVNDAEGIAQDPALRAMVSRSRLADR
jgi:hypothetical protein